MIVAHHGGELSLLQAALASAGSLPVLLLLLRTEIRRLGRRRRWAGTQSEPERSNWQQTRDDQGEQE